MIERRSTTLDLADGAAIAVLQVRDSRAKRMRLLVNERGVRLTLPKRVSERSALAFLRQHRHWLQTTLAKRPLPASAPRLLPELCTHLPLRGEQVPLRWCEGRYARAQLDDHGIVLQVAREPSEARSKAALREFYLAQARADLGRWLPRYVPGLPRAPSLIRIRPLRSLWGSLSVSGVVSMDLSLVLGQSDAFEYVLVHELCHLLQANHSKAFWVEVSARWPDWQRQRDYLRSDGLALKSTLRGLLE